MRLRRAALLHDIGKLTVPNTILDKPARLDPSERAVVEQHPAYTLSLLQRVPVFSAFADDAANHHEWVDGRGYSRGLSGAALSATARILAVADVLEAVTADRPYQTQPMPIEGVEAVLTTGGGTHFDEDCVAACMDGVVELAVASRQAPPRRAGRVAPETDATRYHAAGTSRRMISLSTPIRTASRSGRRGRRPTRRPGRRSAQRTAPLQAILRDRQPRLIVTPAILAVIVAIFVVMVAASGEVAFSAWTLVALGRAVRAGDRGRPVVAAAVGDVAARPSAPPRPERPLPVAVRLATSSGCSAPVVFLIVYLLAGVVASAVSLQFHASNGLSVGASGALFGLVGVLLTVAMTSRGKGGLGEMVAELRPNLLFVVVANLIIGFPGARHRQCGAHRRARRWPRPRLARRAAQPGGETVAAADR